MFRLIYLLVGWVFLFSQFALTTYALNDEQRALYNKNILYYDLDPCSGIGATSSSTTPGSGKPDGAVFPNLSPDSMAQAINTYIEKANPASKLGGLGSTIVAGAKSSNVSPFLIVAIAQKESSLANPSDYNVRHANNSFGRTATSSQPNFQGARLWYKWSSVKASVDNAAAENKNAGGGGDVAAYIRKQYAPALDSNNIQGFFAKYAPEFENDTQKYIDDVGKGIDEMVKLSGSTPSQPADDAPSTTSTGSCSCDGSGGSTDVSLSGTTNAHKAFNYLVGKGLSTKAAAAVTGNLMLESGGNTENISTTIEAPSTGAHGIAQWLGARKQALYSRDGQSSLKIQLDFLWYELTDPAGQQAAVLGSGQPYFGGGKALIDILKTSDDLEYMTIAWERIFERSGVLGQRVENANTIHDKYGGDTRTGNATTSIECGGPEGSGTATGQFAWPISKDKGILYSCYGYARGRLHTGIDIAAAVGTKVVAADGGTVDVAENIDPSGFGNTVIIKHDNGKWTLYAHLSKITVQKGKKVDQGQEIGSSGGAAGAAGSGSSQGPHLHFNIQTQGGAGQGSVDPLKFLPKDGRAVNTAGGDCPQTAVLK